MKKLTKQILGGLIGAITLGIFSGYSFLIYGATYGCFSFVDSLMRDVGYLSCGPFGLLTGAVVGALLGAVLISLNWSEIIKMKIPFKSVFIGVGTGFLVGILYHYVFPVLMLFGFFGNWLHSDKTDPLYYMSLGLDYPVTATTVFVILGIVIGFIVDKNQRK